MRTIRCQDCGVVPCIAHQLDEFRACGATGLYRPRQVIFHEAAPATGMYLLCEGTVKLYQSDRFGRDYIVDVAGPGSILGEIGVGDADAYSVSAEAIIESQICHVPRERLMPLIERHPRMGVQLIASLSGALAAARRRAGALALKRADERLAELLLRLAGQGPPPEDAGAPLRIPLTYSRRELAEMIGVSTETAIRLLTRLRRNRVITIKDGAIVIVDVKRLTALARHRDRAP